MTREVDTSVRGRVVFRLTISLVDGDDQGRLPGLGVDFQFPYGTDQKVEEMLEGGAFGLQHSITEAVNSCALVWRKG